MKSTRVGTDAKCRCRNLLFCAVAAVPVSVAAGYRSTSSSSSSGEDDAERIVSVGPAAAFPEFADIVERGDLRPSDDAAVTSKGDPKTARQMARRLSAKWMDYSRFFSFGRSRHDQGRPTAAVGEEGNGGGSGGDGGNGAREFAGENEAYSIEARDVAFLLQKGQWQGPGGGISMTAKGEAKSGTTWLGRLIPQLALQLCGGPTNEWCEMGGLVVHPNKPSPWYEFEMLKKSASANGGTPTLFLHYKGNFKHVIPGMSAIHPLRGCTNGGRRHENFFEDNPPCVSGDPPTRKGLRQCLWSTSKRCIRFALGSFRRTAVIFRDPRDVVISEFNMRRDYYHQARVKSIGLEDFVRERFETLVSWSHQRWVWHVEALDENSHVMFYDDLQADHLGMIKLAAFMGLECSEDQALEVWKSHRSAPPTHGDYTTRGLGLETVSWMNATMARLLPPPVSLHWGVTPTDV